MTIPEEFVVQVTDTIRTAMEKITNNKHRVVIVLDGRNVVGTVSDGDVRRAFLRDILPISSVEKIMNINCITTTEIDHDLAVKYACQKQVTVLPIINESNELIDIALSIEPFAD